MMAGPRPGRLGRHAQLRKIWHFPARRRVVSRSPDDRAASFHWPTTPTNRTANASLRRGSRGKNRPRYRSSRSFEAAPPLLPPRLASRSHGRSAGITRSALHWSQQGSSFTGHASLPRPTIAPLQIEQTRTGLILRAPLCAPEQAQQRGGRIELSNTRRGLLSPPQAKLDACASPLSIASMLRAHPASTEPRA